MEKYVNKIQTVQYECEDGVVSLGLRKGCVGCWVAVRDRKPLGFTVIRPLQWIARINQNQ